MVSAVPNWLMGLWKRLSIETVNGQRDTETQVFYLQTPTCFADLRIPIDRPDLKQENFSSLTEKDGLALCRQEGFAGIAAFDQGYCHWMRYIDYQPSRGVRDLGLLHWEGNILVEEGVDQVYREEWQKVDDGSGDYTALVLAEGEPPHQASVWQASLVIAGDYFIYSQNRPFALPALPALIDCLTQPAASHKQSDYLSCEISFGLCRSGQVPWEIQRSTLPWREGSALWSPSDLAIDLEKRQILQTVHPGIASEMRSWEIREWGTGKAFKG